MRILVFKPGIWNGEKYDKKFAVSMAERYNKSAEQVPVVIGHNTPSFSKTDADEFAHGWVNTLEMNDEGLVHAQVEDVSDELRELIEDKKLKYASLEFSFEFNKHKKPINPSLRAVALLGRTTPAIKDAKIISLSKDEKDLNVEVVCLTLEERKKEEYMENEKQEAAQTANLEKQLSDIQAELARFQKAELVRKSESFADGFVKNAKVSPAQKDNVMQLHAALSDENKVILESLMIELKPQVELGKDHRAQESSDSGLSLSARVKAYQKKHKIESFADALDALYAEDVQVREMV